MNCSNYGIWQILLWQVYLKDSCSPWCSLTVEILPDCSQNYQSAKINLPPKFLVIQILYIIVDHSILYPKNYRSKCSKHITITSHKRPQILLQTTLLFFSSTVCSMYLFTKQHMYYIIMLYFQMSQQFSET